MSESTDATSVPDGVTGHPEPVFVPDPPTVSGEQPRPIGEPGTCDDSGKCYIRGDEVPRGAPETPNPDATRPPTPNPPDYSQVTSQVEGEMLIANLLVEIANLTRRALVAETMVQMYQRAAQPKSAQ